MIETVRIVKKNHAGSAIINKADFDPKKHELFDKPKIEDKGPTKDQIMEALKAADIKFDPAMKKDVLAELLAKGKQE